MKASPRYIDGAFRNTARVAPGLKKGTVAPTISEFLCGGQRRTPRGPLPSVNPLEGLSRPPETPLRATWLGHSTVLLEMDGVRVLTDPVWGERASPVTFAGPSYGSGNLGTGATCHETVANLNGGNCSNISSPRALTVNGVAMNCSSWTLPAKRNGGYCVQVNAGTPAWSAFVTW